MFLENYWYAVAWDHEINRAPFGRAICGQPIILYRQTSGALLAFEDCCPHQLLPLSKGFLQGDQLICKYHGLKFNEGGQCVWMPGQEGIHKQATIRSYPVAEKASLRLGVDWRPSNRGSVQDSGTRTGALVPAGFLKGAPIT